MRHDEDGRRALDHRDHGCRFPGCGIRFTQGHHLRHWAEGGPTTLSNLALLCRRHHRAVHEEGYGVERGLDGNLRFRRTASPLGRRIHARTACAGWLGERLDVGWAIDVLHPLAARPA